MTWHPWNRWECYGAGMYDGPCELSYENGMNAYADFLSDIPRFNRAMDGMMRDWPISCEHFLTKPGNRLAWLGQASACWEMGIPRRFRNGFNLMSLNEQRAANQAARTKLEQWEHAQEDRSLHSEVEGTGIPGRRSGRGASGVDAYWSGAVLQGHSLGDTAQRSSHDIARLSTSEVQVVP